MNYGKANDVTDRLYLQDLADLGSRSKWLMARRTMRLLTLVGLLTGLAGLAPGLAMPEVAQGVAQTVEQRKAEADRLLQQGIQQLQSNSNPAAKQSFEQALMIYRQVQHQPGVGAALSSTQVSPRKAEADSLLQHGIVLFESRQFEAALQAWQRALNIYRNINDQEGEKITLGNLGSAYNALNNYAKAIEYSDQALVLAQETRDRQTEGQALGNLSVAYFGITNYGKTIDYSEQRLVIARELKDQGGEERALRYLGNSYFQLGAYKKAIEYQEKRLAVVQIIKDYKGEGQASAVLGNAYGRLGNYAKAIEYSKQAFTIAQKLKDRAMEILALGNLGAAYSEMGNYSKAVVYQEKRLAATRKFNNRGEEGEALGGLGNAYREMGNYSKAIELHEQQLAIAQEIKDRQKESKALSSLGSDYGALGNYSKAIEFYEQSLAIAREIKYRNGEGSVLGNLGNIYQELGNYNKAIEYQKQHLAIAREFKDRRSEGIALSNLGNTYFFLGDYNKAVEHYGQSLEILEEIQDRQGLGIVALSLANVYRTFGSYSKAVELYEQSLAISRELKTQAGEGKALGGLGNAYYYQGKYSKAIEFYQQYLAIAREIQDRLGEGQSLNNLGAALLKSGKLTAAEKTLFDGIAVWELLRQTGVGNDAQKISIFEQQARTYRILQRVLVAQNKTNRALEIAERGRARAFVELLAQRLATDAKAEKTDKQATRSALAVSPSVAQIQQIAKAQNATLVQYSILFDGFKIQGKEEARQSELYIWVIPPTGEISFRTVDLKPLWQQQNSSLADLVEQSRDTIGARGRSDVWASQTPEQVQRLQAQQTRNLKQLHGLLIAPIADLLPQDPNQRVIFMPQGELFLVPFPALLDARGTALIEQHTILTAPSIQVLELTRQQRQAMQPAKHKTQNALIVGNPTMPKVVTRVGDPPVQLSDLPGAKQEAVAIAKLFNTQAITGAQATKTAIAQQMPQARIIHLATHGLLDDTKGLGVPGAIALAPAGTGELNDGLLTAAEILDMRLNAELVVLSACDTGRGRITGDGVIGLSRSLITAGVPSIVVSLWKVPDDSTAFLMTEFYKNLRTTNDKAQALRQAMLMTKQKYSDPLHWAAFTLIGEAE